MFHIQLSEVDLIKTKTIKTLSLISIFSRFAYSADAARIALMLPDWKNFHQTSPAPYAAFHAMKSMKAKTPISSKSKKLGTFLTSFRE